MPHLVLEGRANGLNDETLSRWTFEAPPLELLNQVGRNGPSLGPDRPDKLPPFELPQAAYGSHLIVVGSSRVGSEYAARVMRDLSDVAVDGTNSRLALGTKGHEVASAQALRLPRIKRNVEGLAARSLKHRVQAAFDFVGETLRGDPPD
jgi:hypothetical protein